MSATVDILAFSPHPDDAEIGCGGLLLLSVRQGLTTAIVDLTEGEKSTRGTVSIRRSEKELASQRLGLTRRVGLRLPDTQIGLDPAHEAAVVAQIRELRPRLILAPCSEDRHPDHAEASRLIDRAAFFAGVGAVGSGAPHRAERLLHYCVHRPVIPTVVFDVSSVWPEYRNTVAAYQSQFFDGGNDKSTALSDGTFIEAIEARGRYYGAMINASFGEPYMSPAPLRIDSPLSLLRPADTNASYGSFR